MQTQSGIAFGVMIQPLAQPSQYDHAEGYGEVPQIDFLEDGPFRCGRCKAYVNPAFQFIQEGRKATCNLCLTETAVPDHYFCSLNEYGRRLDREKRPELLYGTYEIKAPSMFADKTPQTPTFVFFLDVSLQAFQTGFFHQCLSSIKASLESMPQPEKTRVCVATYD
jgi:protein transport protein SEC24